MPKTPPHSLSLEVSDGWATLWLDRPPRNEMDRPFFAELERLQREELSRLNVHGLIISGRGRHFSSGANIDELKQRLARTPTGAIPSELQASADTFSAIEQLPYPVLAAIDGCCLGSALEFALACHYRLATPSALLALPELSFGLMPGCGATVRLPERIGLGPSIELILGGGYLTAAQALTMGLVDAIVSRAALMTKAREFIIKLGNPGGPL